MGIEREQIRNVAIIAHVDHGKTTLVDGMLQQSGIFRSNQTVQERVMDSNDLERERGITILSKNTAVMYDGYKINIVDTPGHADFGGEVERILKMVDGVILLVDSFEGAMPQTKFVLRKALSLNLKPIVVINKVDRADARLDEVMDEIIDLFIEVGGDDIELDFPVIYASSRHGFAMIDKEAESEDLKPLFDTIVEYVPSPSGEISEGLQILISNIESDEYVGRIAIGKIERGKISSGQQAVVCRKGEDSVTRTIKIGKLYVYEGLNKVECEEAGVGDIVAISGLGDVNIGDTVCDVEIVEPLDYIKIDEPTITIDFNVNNSPFAGKEGDFVTSRHLRDRLFKELDNNLSLRVEEKDTADSFKVSGRGELHLTILMENMRREGYEFSVSKPKVIIKDIDGVLCEPMEIVTIDVPEEFMGSVIEKMGVRKGEMQNMSTISSGLLRLEFKIPSRGLIGYRSEFLTDTKGNGIMNSILAGFEEVKGEINSRLRGSMVAWETGTSVAYGLYNAQERGTLFITAGIDVYEGMVVGQNAKSEDIVVNVCKKKHVTNMRASGSDEALRLSPPTVFSLEECLEYISDDELVEITPKNTRLRKKVLNNNMRAKIESKNKKG